LFRFVLANLLRDIVTALVGHCSALLYILALLAMWTLTAFLTCAALLARYRGTFTVRFVVTDISVHVLAFALIDWSAFLLRDVFAFLASGVFTGVTDGIRSANFIGLSMALAFGSIWNVAGAGVRYIFALINGL